MIFDKQDRVLLMHKSDYDLWDLPGGGMQQRESFVDCLRREIKEETGLKLLSHKFVGVYNRPDRNDLVLQFICEVEEGDIVLDYESDKFAFFNLNEIPENTAKTHKASLNNYRKDTNKVYAEIIRGEGSIEAIIRMQRRKQS